MILQYLLCFFGGVLFALAIFLAMLGASDALRDGSVEDDIHWPIDHPKYRRANRDRQ